MLKLQTKIVKPFTLGRVSNQIDVLSFPSREICVKGVPGCLGFRSFCNQLTLTWILYVDQLNFQEFSQIYSACTSRCPKWMSSRTEQYNDFARCSFNHLLISSKNNLQEILFYLSHKLITFCYFLWYHLIWLSCEDLQLWSNESLRVMVIPQIRDHKYLKINLIILIWIQVHRSKDSRTSKLMGVFVRCGSLKFQISEIWKA